MKHKHLLLKVIETLLPDGPVGVEIGVDRADTTKYFLENCSNICHLYAVDPYLDRDGRYKTVKDQLAQYPNCTLIRNTSDEAACIIPDDLDFVFIDGDHSCLAVLSDLQNYVPKIRSGGLLTGHDWTSVNRNMGVVQAAEEYLYENESLFQPLFSNEELVNMNLSEFKRGGWSERAQRNLIHKKSPSGFPLWWLVKR